MKVSRPSDQAAIVLVLLGTLSILFRCTPHQLPQDITQQKSVVLPVRIDSIIFVDERPDTLTVSMDLPVFASKSKEWVVKPGLSTSLRKEIIEIINRASNPVGLPCTVTVHIEEGHYKILGNSSQVQEYAKFDSRLEFELDEGGGFNTSASAYNELVGIFNATEAHVQAMYRITVRNSIFTALTYAEDALAR